MSLCMSAELSSCGGAHVVVHLNSPNTKRVKINKHLKLRLLIYLDGIKVEMLLMMQANVCIGDKLFETSFKNVAAGVKSAKQAEGATSRACVAKYANVRNRMFELEISRRYVQERLLLVLW